MTPSPLLPQFASDNNSGIHPQILDSIIRANASSAPAYGGDPWTERCLKLFKENFGEHSETFFVLNGTAANVLAIQALTRPYHAVICSEHAHILQDECGAPSRQTGCTLLPVRSPDGKLTPSAVERAIQGLGNPHKVQPKVISITQCTELGTVYSIPEIRALADLAHRHQMVLHVDGARISNAAAHLNCSWKEMTTDAGVDVLSFGGTKIGLLLGEAVVFCQPQPAQEAQSNFEYIRKQGMQLSSKMRFIAAQFETLLSQKVWLQSATHSNAMAQLLAEGLHSIPHVQVLHPVESNAVFARLERRKMLELQKQFRFYEWTPEENTSVVRWMTSFDTTPEEIRAFLRAIRE